MSKDSVRDEVSNGFAHNAIGKEDDAKQRTRQGSEARLPKYEAEDKIAAEKLLQTTYRDRKMNEAKKSEGESSAMVMPRVMVEGRRHRLDSQGDSRQGGFLFSNQPDCFLAGSETEKRKTWRVSCEIVSDEEDSGDEYAR